MSYGRYTLAKLSKILNVQQLTLSPPRLVPLLLLVDGQHTEHATCLQERLLMHFPRMPTATHRSSLMTYNSE